MASIVRDPNGRKRILFVAADGKSRPAVRLGKACIDDARTWKTRIEAILSAARIGRSIDNETAGWLGGLNDRDYGKLAGVGLVEARQTPDAPTDPARTLAATIEAFDASKLKAKKSTRVHWGHTWRNLKAYFGDDKDIAEITEADAGTWSEWLDVQEKLSLPTARKRCGNAKQLFAFAVRKRLISSNPFGWVKSANVTNRGRDYFLTQDDAQRVIDACPDWEWRLLFALSRYGGLRCPSEHLSLRWNDVDFPRSRMRSPKPENGASSGGRIARDSPIHGTAALPGRSA